MVPGMPWALLQAAMVEGVDLEVDPAAFEFALIAHTDAHRVGSFLFEAVGPEVREGNWELVFEGGAWREARPDESPMAKVGLSTGIARATLDVSGWTGQRLAPYAVALAAWLDAHAGTQIGAVEASG